MSFNSLCVVALGTKDLFVGIEKKEEPSPEGKLKFVSWGVLNDLLSLSKNPDIVNPEVFMVLDRVISIIVSKYNKKPFLRSANSSPT